jgi:hypothetical protein
VNATCRTELLDFCTCPSTSWSRRYASHYNVPSQQQHIVPSKETFVQASKKDQSSILNAPLKHTYQEIPGFQMSAASRVPLYRRTFAPDTSYLSISKNVTPMVRLHTEPRLTCPLNMNAKAVRVNKIQFMHPRLSRVHQAPPPPESYISCPLLSSMASN